MQTGLGGSGGVWRGYQPRGIGRQAYQDVFLQRLPPDDLDATRSGKAQIRIVMFI